jgi:hypothetical protein
MGRAAWYDGCEAGKDAEAPREAEIRVDLTLKEFGTIWRLAHYGFKRVMWDKDVCLMMRRKHQAPSRRLSSANRKSGSTRATRIYFRSAVRG